MENIPLMSFPMTESFRMEKLRLCDIYLNCQLEMFLWDQISNKLLNIKHHNIGFTILHIQDQTDKFSWFRQLNSKHIAVNLKVIHNVQGRHVHNHSKARMEWRMNPTSSTFCARSWSPFEYLSLLNGLAEGCQSESSTSSNLKQNQQTIVASFIFIIFFISASFMFTKYFKRKCS